MRIGILSDIHIDDNYDSGGLDKLTPAVCDSILNNNLDVFITAGDISSDFELSLDVVGRIEKATGRGCLFVPGNHDLWNLYHPGKTADYIYRQFLTHPHNLANGPVRLKSGWSAAGDTCWYDFSFGGREPSADSEGSQWPDLENLSWEKSDKAVHDFFMARLRCQLQACGSDRVIAVSHMVPLEDFLQDKPFAPYYGSSALGRLLLETPSVSFSVCGHLHRRSEIERSGKHFICQALGTRNRWVAKDDPFTETAISMKVIEI